MNTLTAAPALARTTTAPPAGPHLRLPDDDAHIDAHALTFEWVGAANETYVLEVARDAEFTDVVARVPTGTSTSVTVYDLFRPDGARYHWRVASSTAGTGSLRSFVAAKYAAASPNAPEGEEREQASESPRASVSAPPDAVRGGASTTDPPPYRQSITSPRQSAVIILVMLISFLITLGIIFSLSGQF